MSNKWDESEHLNQHNTYVDIEYENSPEKICILFNHNPKDQPRSVRCDVNKSRTIKFFDDFLLF